MMGGATAKPALRPADPQSSEPSRRYPEAWWPDKVTTLPAYNPDTKAKDRQDAAQMLSAAGYPNGKGVDFEIVFSSAGDESVDNATRAVGQLPTVLPEMTVRLHPHGCHNVRRAAGRRQVPGGGIHHHRRS